MAAAQKGIPKKHNKYSSIGARYTDYRGEYTVWCNMRYRCNNPDNDMYKLYGGRGIKVCDRWNNKNGFKNFFIDMGKRPFDDNGKPYQLDRIDVNGNYCPENCRWVPAIKNARNKRTNVIFYIYGEPMCLAEVSKLFGLHRSSIRGRMVRTGEDKYTALLKLLLRKGYTITPLTKERNIL